MATFVEQKNLAPSTKLRMVRQAKQLVDALTSRLGACTLEEFAKVKAQLGEAQADLAIIAGMATKPKRRRQ